MTITDGSQLARRRTGGLRGYGVAAVLLVVAGLALAAAFAVGRHAGTESRGSTLTGRAYVGADEASVRVDGWAYGFVPSTVTWYDAAGAHDGTTAPCLQGVGTYAQIRFGYVTAPLPDSSSSRVVTWVRCLS